MRYIFEKLRRTVSKKVKMYIDKIIEERREQEKRPTQKDCEKKKLGRQKLDY